MTDRTDLGDQVATLIESGGGLLNQNQVGALLGHSSTSTTAWRVIVPGFPAPVASGGERTGKKLWLRADIEEWHRRHGGVRR